MQGKSNSGYTSVEKHRGPKFTLLTRAKKSNPPNSGRDLPVKDPSVWLLSCVLSQKGKLFCQSFGFSFPLQIITHSQNADCFKIIIYVHF